MKKILFAVLAFGALVACTNEEVIEIDREAIEFGDVFVNNSTRAIYTPTSLPGSFEVWGGIKDADNATYYEVFNNATVTNNTAQAGHIWAYTGDLQYWIYNATYQFAAIVDDADQVSGIELTDCVPTKFNYTNTSGTSDLLYNGIAPFVRAKNDADKVVRFDFEHLLSKVNVNVTNTPKRTNYNFKVTAMTVTTPDAATYTVGTGWSDNTVDSTLPFEFADAYISKDGTKANAEKVFIPCDYAANDLVVKFTIDWYYNNHKVSTENLEVKNTAAAVEFEAGKAYNLNITYGLDEAIQFSVATVDAWDDNNGTGNNVTLN